MSDRLQEIRARLDAATPGEWSRYPGPSSDVVAETVTKVTKVARQVRRVDADFIAHAPDDIAWLLEQVEELTKRVRMYEVVKS